MKTSQRGIDFIKEAEGLRLEAYQCSANVWTVGYGATRIMGKPVKQGDKITTREAEAILKSDLREFEDAINQSVKTPMTQSQFDALVSLVFNIGIGAFRRSTILRKMNEADYAGAALEFPRWNKVGGKVNRGLTLRRAREASLFVEDEWDKDNEPNNVQGGIKRDVPSVINTENVNAAAAVAGGMGAMNLDGDNPMSWALAIIALVSAGVFFYLFFKRRGA
jgi:lysozyme